ncbi:MAG: aspartyl/glutamyl-tRNA amidotransferase subunit C [SAR324 cluster bacterium]|nr:aspartyl/glutamyl-tRNA amidotransferase subunit C [SAR324 cluster bacterium]
MFTIEQVNKIAELSSLTLTAEEKIQFAQQFSQVLDYFEKLNTLDLPQNLEDRDEQFCKISREDVLTESSVTPDSFSPYLHNNLFRVPKVIDQG